MNQYVCINNSEFPKETWTTSPHELEIGKSYISIREDAQIEDNRIVLMILLENVGWYYKDRFVTLDEWRNRQLSKIDI